MSVCVEMGGGLRREHEKLVTERSALDSDGLRRTHRGFCRMRLNLPGTYLCAWDPKHCIVYLHSDTGSRAPSRRAPNFTTSKALSRRLPVIQCQLLCTQRYPIIGTYAELGGKRHLPGLSRVRMPAGRGGSNRSTVSDACSESCTPLERGAPRYPHVGCSVSERTHACCSLQISKPWRQAEEKKEAKDTLQADTRTRTRSAASRPTEVCRYTTSVVLTASGLRSDND